MAIDLESLSAINSSPLPYDLFRDVHKGLRRALFAVIEQAGRADYTDEDERRATLSAVSDLVGLLRCHQQHEDTHIAPVVAQRCRPVAAMASESQVEVDAMIGRLQVQVGNLTNLRGCDAITQGLDLYRSLAAFAGRYLLHLAFEEGNVMAALRDAMSIGELSLLDRAIRDGLTADEVCGLAGVMAPALNIDERAALLTHLRSTRADLFDRVLAVFESTLEPGDYCALSARVGLAEGDTGWH